MGKASHRKKRQQKNVPKKVAKDLTNLLAGMSKEDEDYASKD